MKLDLESCKISLSILLHNNPTVTNSCLASIFTANISNFHGSIKISDAVHSFHSDGYEGVRKDVKVIHISPYSFWKDFWVTIKRMFAGVQFSNARTDNDLATRLAEGRRVTIFCAIDGSEASALVEVDQKSLFYRLNKAVKAVLCC